MVEEHFANLRSGVSAWLELAEGLEETPLFPVDPLAEYLQFLAPVLVDDPKWGALVEMVDNAIARVYGSAAVADRARDRAMELLRAGRYLEAIEEVHRAKVEWWSGDTVQGSLLAMLVLSDLYLELRFPQAAKMYALATAYVAATSSDDRLTGLVSRALLMAARADFLSGAWCSAAELFELGLIAQYNTAEGGFDSLDQEEVNSILLRFSWISTCAKDVDPVLTTSITAIVARLGLQEAIDELVDVIPPTDQDFWVSSGTNELTSLPFSDLGPTRYIKFSGLGLNWTVHSTNDTETTRMAERFATAVQVMLAALAREDLCIVPTHINVRVERQQRVAQTFADCITSLSSNVNRRWVVQLVPVAPTDNAQPDRIDQELLSMLSTILLDVSLLPNADFFAAIEKAFKRGINHKLSPVRPYDELAAMFADEHEAQIERRNFKADWDTLDGTFSPHIELRWQDGPGPTFSREKAEQLLHTRYDILGNVFETGLPKSWDVAAFRQTIRSLKESGWLDWHILTAIYNIVLSYRIQTTTCGLEPRAVYQEALRYVSVFEAGTLEDIPAALFTRQRMEDSRKTAMLSLLKHWGLELHQSTPDFPGLERLLAWRYGYWSDDIEHETLLPRTG